MNMHECHVYIGLLMNYLLDTDHTTLSDRVLNHLSSLPKISYVFRRPAGN